MFVTPPRPCRFLALPRPSLKFFQYCIDLEANLASIGNHDAIVNARKLYDSSVDLYPQERELWRNYYSMELKVRLHIANMFALADITLALHNQVGTSETANAIYWRARKVLNDSTALAIPCS